MSDHARRALQVRISAAAVAAVLLAAGLALLTAPFTAAAVVPTAWTVTATPMTLTEGQATDVTLTVTGGSDRIRCLVVSVPAGFTVLSVGVVSVPPGETWQAQFAGNAPTTVTFSLGSGGGGIKLLQVGSFRVQVMATMTLISAWTTNGYGGKTANSPDVGPPLLPLQPFLILPGPTPTATATPTPTPTATDTSTPDPTATATVGPSSTPTPAPTPSPTRSPSPSPARTPAPTPGATPSGSSTASTSASPSSTITAEPSASSVGPEPPLGGAGAGTAGGRPPTDQGIAVPDPQAGIAISVGDVGSVDVLGFAWLVPGALLGLPGLLLVLIIGAQAALAGLFVPLTRRVLTEREPRRTT